MKSIHVERSWSSTHLSPHRLMTQIPRWHQRCFFSDTFGRCSVPMAGPDIHEMNWHESHSKHLKTIESIWNVFVLFCFYIFLIVFICFYVRFHVVSSFPDWPDRSQWSLILSSLSSPEFSTKNFRIWFRACSFILFHPFSFSFSFFILCFSSSSSSFGLSCGTLFQKKKRKKTTQRTHRAQRRRRRKRKRMKKKLKQ